MARLTIRLLGPFSVILDQEPVSDFESDKVRALLAYLATEPDRPHRREALAGLLWPERPERDARRNLRHALASLRLAIADNQDGANFLLISRKTIQFNSQSDAWCDAANFIEIVDGSSPAQQTIPQLEQAAALYGGPFLEGFSLPDSVLFGEWLLVKREQFQHRALSFMHRLAAHYEALGDCESALVYAWRQVELEPWREEAHRQAMRLLAMNGQRGAALAQYEACRRALSAELQVAPARETIDLYEQIRDGTLPGAGGVVASAASPVNSSTSWQPAARPNAKAASWGRRHFALVGLVSLLGLILAMAYSRPWERVTGEQPASLSMVAELSEGRVAHLCEEESNRARLCVFDFATGQYAALEIEVAFAHIAPSASWSPSGRQIVFAAGLDQNDAAPTNHEIFVVGSDGAGLERLTNNDANDLMPAWSPDGDWIAYHRGGELWLMRADGSEPRRVLGRPLDVCISGLAWSPDSQKLALLNGSCGPNQSSVPEIAIINPGGEGLKVIHTFEQPLLGGELAWSPDGREIICLCIYSEWHEEILQFSGDGRGEPRSVDHAPPSWFANYWPQWLEQA